MAERLGKLRGEIASARYYLEEIQERKDALEKELQPLKDPVERVRMARENILEKDREAREKLAKLRQEQKGNFPVCGVNGRDRFRQRYWQNRRASASEKNALDGFWMRKVFQISGSISRRRKSWCR